MINRINHIHSINDDDPSIYARIHSKRIPMKERKKEKKNQNENKNEKIE